MIKTHWVKRAVAFGAAVTLAVTCMPLNSNDSVSNASAAVLCQETEMAGLSLSLDKYYTTNYLETKTQVADNTVEENVAEPEATAEPTATPEAKEEKKETKKKTTVSKRWQTTGISIASDYVNIRRHPKIRDSKVIGKLYRGSAARILRNCKGGWVQIESGDVKGYIKKEFLAIGAKAEALADKYGTKYMTVKEGTITLNVRTKTSTKSNIVTQISEDDSFYVEKLCGENWVRISVDGDRGYVAKEFVDVKVKFKKAISRRAEREAARRKAAARRAEQERLRALEEQQRQEAEEAQQSSSSSSSVSQSSSSSSSSSNSSSSSSSSTSSANSDTGAQIASYAQKFVGNPYVYGGTSLTNGTDCSGFTMSVYAQFGYSIPRTSSAQSGYGTSVSLSDVKPGDLIFYKNGNSVGHVAMYIGGGNVVHASNPSDGIKISNMYYRQPCGARRIVD